MIVWEKCGSDISVTKMFLELAILVSNAPSLVIMVVGAQGSSSNVTGERSSLVEHWPECWGGRGREHRGSRGGTRNGFMTQQVPIHRS